MKILRTCASLLALSLVAPVASASTASSPRVSHSASELRARCDPGLESLRAGRSRGSDRLRQDERVDLLAAQEQGADLLEMRAGVGAVEVLLILALVLLILVLI